MPCVVTQRKKGYIKMSSLKGSIKDTVDRDSESDSLFAGCDFVGEITTEPAKGETTVLKVSNIRRTKEFVLKDLEVDDIPGYIDVACLGNGRIVFADYKNSRCCLCSSYYQHLSEFKLSSKPWSVCPMDTNEVAIVLPDENKIQLLRVDDSIQPSGVVKTTRACVAVVALGRNEFIFCDSGTKSDRNIYWGVIANDGREKSCFHFSSGNMHSRTVYLVLNSAKTQVYISCSATQSVLCFELNGKMKFEYKIENSCPKGIDLDCQDNVYVVLHESSSICLLSPNGHLQRTFSSHIPIFPIALSFKQSTNEFILTNGSETDQRICYVYQLC